MIEPGPARARRRLARELAALVGKLRQIGAYAYEVIPDDGVTSSEIEGMAKAAAALEARVLAPVLAAEAAARATRATLPTLPPARDL